jgi:hypothetical protein
MSVLKERRWFPRFSVRRGVTATIHLAEDSERNVRLVNIGNGGAYVENANFQSQEPETGHVGIIFAIDAPNGDDGDPVERECEILHGRTGPSGGAAVRFFSPLADSELAMLAAPPTATTSIRLAHEDYRIVNEEIIHIQACRNQIFIGALAAISAWIITALGVGLPGRLMFPSWLALGASFPYIILSVALFATIEKANAINLRRGFLAALGEYMSSDVPPPKYLGWAHLRVNMAECKSRVRAGFCPSRDKTCWQDEVGKAHRLTGKHWTLSGGFKSFSAFVALIHGLFYVVATVLLVVAGIYGFLGPSRPWETVLWVGVGLGVVVILLTLSLISQLRQLRKGSKSPEAYYLRWTAALRYCKPIRPSE